MKPFIRVNTELLAFRSKSYKVHALDYNIAADRISQLEIENEEREKTIEYLEELLATKNKELEIEINKKNAEIDIYEGMK